MALPENIAIVDFVGAGNVANALGKVFVENNIAVGNIFSSHYEKSLAMAKLVNGTATDNIQNIGKNADLVILAIPDKEIEKVSTKLSVGNSVVVHTSGNQDVSNVGNHVNYGVFYPLQTFSLHTPVDFGELPICIESNSSATANLLTNLGEKISNKVVNVDSESRRKIHLAAVTVSNFSNLMYNIAYDYLRENDIDFDILLPLIRETANKITDLSPKKSQTGPAVRNDITTINNHLKLLDNNKDFKEIYSLLTDKIIQIHNEKL